MKIQMLSALAMALALTSSLRCQVPQGASQIQSTRTELIQKIQSLKFKYAKEPILFGSVDYQIFDELSADLKTAGSLIQELIDLTEVQRKRPDTTESFSAYSLSPAGGLLVVLRENSEPEIRSRLAKGDLSPRQKEVLQEVIQYIERFRSREARN